MFTLSDEDRIDGQLEADLWRQGVYRYQQYDDSPVGMANWISLLKFLKVDFSQSLYRLTNDHWIGTANYHFALNLDLKSFSHQPFLNFMLLSVISDPLHILYIYTP